MARVLSIAVMAGLTCEALALPTINVDFNSTDGSFGTYSGTAAAPDPGTIWNGVPIGPEAGAPLIAGFASGSLVTSTGAASTVTLSLGNFRVYEADERPASLASALMTDFAYQQNLGPGGVDSTFSLSNLNPGSTYDLYLYAQNGGYSNTATIFAINGFSQTATNPGFEPGAFVQDQNYVLYLGLVPSGGTIAGTFNDAAAANNAAFNGLQLVEHVPEPTAIALLASAGLLVVSRRRS